MIALPATMTLSDRCEVALILTRLLATHLERCRKSGDELNLSNVFMAWRDLAGFMPEWWPLPICPCEPGSAACGF